MAPLTPGSDFPADVSFSYIQPTGTLDLTVCGLPSKYDASKGPSSLSLSLSLSHTHTHTHTYTHTQKDTDIPPEFATKKVVLVSVPGAFTPTCQEQHVVSYLANLDKLKAKGVDSVIFIAFNDPFVMSAWGKANGINDDSIVCFLVPSSFPFCCVINVHVYGMLLGMLSMRSVVGC